MKNGKIKPLPVLKAAPHSTTASAKRPDGLPVHPLLDAWLARPPQPSGNLLGILRSRSN